MTLSATQILSSLKDYSQCNDELVVEIKSTVLEPFQPDLSRIQAGQRIVKPTRAEFKAMTTKLAPLAMRIVNQSIESLRDLKQKENNKDETLTGTSRRTTIRCLIDCASYSIAGLKHMSASTTLKPFDIEKTMSNLICKIVDLGEYTRALDELTKLRSSLANAINVSTENVRTQSVSTTTVTTSISTMKPSKEHLSANSSPRRGFLTESPNRLADVEMGFHSPVATRNAPVTTSAPAEFASANSPWEDSMLQKYGDLFTLPLDKTINDITTVLLVLAYQMNTIRSWTDIADSTLVPHLPRLLDRSGNFLDWCRHLMTLDPILARKQFGSLHRQLCKAASKAPLSDIGSGKSFALQAMGMVALKHTDTVPIKSLCNRMVQIGISYERLPGRCDYRSIQKYCAEVLDNLSPDISNIVELDSYFVLCEYYAYASRKAKSYSGAFYAYKHMIRPLRNLVDDSGDCTYYHAAYAATAKLALGSVQLEKLVTGNTYADMTTTLTEINRCLSAVHAAEESYKQANDHTDQALNSLLKSIDMFRQSCARYFEFADRKAKKKLENNSSSNSSTPTSTPILSGRSSLSSAGNDWSACIPAIISALQHTSDVLPSAMRIMKRKPWRGKPKQLVSLNEVMSAFVEIMVLLAHMRFDIDDEDSYESAYESLSTAEDMCVFNGFSNGYRWISNTYYKIGVTFHNAQLYAAAVYPLRKACSLLEKDNTRASTDSGKLQLCKRYEVLGTCCQKDKRFEDATKAFRLALKRLPSSTIEAFVKEADSMAIYTLMGKHPLIPKLIERYLRATISDESDVEVSFASEAMDLRHLESSQKSIIYECELRSLYMISSSADCTRQQNAILNTLLRHYTVKSYPIRRARVLLDKVRFELGKNKPRKTAMKAAIGYASEAAEILQLDSYANDSDLLQYRRHYLALSSSWAGICTAELDKASPEYFSMAFHQWGALLKDIDSIYSNKKTTDDDLKAVYRQIDDVDKLYDHFRMLTDFFAVKQQHVHYISTLRLMLKLNNGLRRTSEDQISASIINTVNIGRIYSDLGYSGKADVEFSMAERAIRQQPCTNEAELTYILFYSSHLARTGELDRSKRQFNTSRIVWESVCQGESSNALRNERRQMARRLMMADAYYTRSILLSQADPLVDQSIQDCTTALRILNYCSRTVQQNMAAKSRKTSPLSDPFADSNTPETIAKSRDESAIASSISFRESEWTIAQKMTVCLLQLAELHLIRGSWRDAQYYLEKGQELGERLHSQIMKFKFLVAFSDYNLRCGSINSSILNLKDAKEVQPEGDIYIREDAELNMAAGNVDADQGCLSDAIKSYDVAEEDFQKIVDAGYIATIEYLVQRSEDLVKLRTKAQESDPEDAIQYTCSFLQNLRGTNSIYKAMTLAQESSVSDALSLLEDLEKSNTMTKNELDLHAAIAQVQSMLVYLELQERKGVYLANGEVQTLPSIDIQQTRAIVKRGTVRHELRHIQSNLTRALESILRTHRNTAYQSRIQVVRDLCLLAGSFMFPQNHFSGRDKFLVRNYAALSAYYLEMSKGLTIRREMQRCLMAKIEALSGKRPADNDVKWPENIVDEQDMNNDRMDIDSMMMRPPSLFGGSNLPWLKSHLEYLSDAYNVEHDLDDIEFQKKFVDIIPPHWTVCSLTMDPITEDLYVVRLQTEKTPTVVKLPLQRSATRPNAEGESIDYTSAVEELRQIISDSDKTISNAKYHTEKSAVNEWWRKRMQLDLQLKRLLNTVESDWFGGFKGLLCGNYHEDGEGLSKFQRNINQLVHSFVYGLPPTGREKEKSQKTIDVNLDMCRVFLRLGSDPSSRELDDIIYFLLSCYTSHGVAVDNFRADMTQLKSQLRGEINQYHEAASVKGIDTMEIEQDNHVILITDKHLHQLPWESLPILRSQSVSRIPCLSFLRDRIMRNLASAGDDVDTWPEVTINSQKTCYVLNPSGDLVHTQNEFEAAFKSMEGWQGLIQEKPVEHRWQSMLESRDLYLYFGHSAGQSIIRGQNIKKLKQCPVAILMGCSSGTLIDKGEYDADGYIMNYLLGGSPAVVANLWDVTDKSIDQLTGKMLNTWGLLKQNANRTPVSLVEAVSSSRDACTLPYLIGAAPVVYGVPVYIKRS